MPVRRRAREDHGLRVELLIGFRIRVRPRPVVLVRGPVEVDVVEEAPVDVHDPGVLARNAEVLAVVNVEATRIIRTGNRAVEVRVELRAVLEVPDLVRERDVRQVRRPRVPAGVRGAVLRVERVGRRGARVRARRVENVGEPVGNRCRHRSTLVGGQVGEVGPVAVWRVVHVDPDHVARLHHQVPVEVRVHGGEVRVVEGAREQGIRGSLRDAALRDVRPVDRLHPTEDVVVAGLCVVGVRVLVPVEAVDRHRRAVAGCRAAEALELRHVPGAVELELQECVPGMLADVVRSARVRSLEVVCVRVGRARLRELRRRLAVAERQPEPEGRSQLEVPRPAGAVLLRFRRRVVRQAQRVGHVVRRARLRRPERDGGFVVAHVLVTRGLEGVATQRVVAFAERLASQQARGRCCRGGRRSARAQHECDGLSRQAGGAPSWLLLSVQRERRACRGAAPGASPAGAGVFAAPPPLDGGIFTPRSHGVKRHRSRRPPRRADRARRRC